MIHVSKWIHLSNTRHSLNSKSSIQKRLRVHSRTECRQSSNPVTVTQAEGYKCRNDRSSSVTAFTTNHSCVNRALGPAGAERKKNQFHCPEACDKASQPRQLVFLGSEGRSGQTCNFSSSHPAAYFFLCQLLAAASACGLLDLTKVACGPRGDQRLC